MQAQVAQVLLEVELPHRGEVRKNVRLQRSDAFVLQLQIDTTAGMGAVSGTDESIGVREPKLAAMKGARQPRSAVASRRSAH